jgi:mannose-6-phosphate isomerase-like protein (cupin superfamily)
MKYHVMECFVLRQGEGKQINFRGTKMHLKVSENDSEGKYSLIEMTHPPNIGPALHIHPKAPEAYYVLDGNYTIQCGERTFHAKAGEFVFIPKGVPHKYQSGSKGGTTLVISRQDWRNTLRKLLIFFRLARLHGHQNRKSHAAAVKNFLIV